MSRPYFWRLTTLMGFIVSVLPTHFVAAADATVTIAAYYRQDAPVTLDIASTSDIFSLDPAIATDVVSFTAIENLFLGLTDFDPLTNTIEPELAMDWTVSTDGLTWTFTLRHDVQWMQYDPATQTITPLRPVVASDFVYGIKRACDPRLTGYYGTMVAARVIAGCDVVNSTEIDLATDELVYGDTTQVAAPNDTTLVITLQTPAGYFLAMTTMPILRPVPKEIVDIDTNALINQSGRPKSIVTNGSYFVQEIIRGVRCVFVRNTALPADLAGNGNIEEINILVIEDGGTIYALYGDNQLDYSPVPQPEVESVLADERLLPEVRQIREEVVFYFAFNYDKPPFDNVHVRRAFSAILDRQAFIAQIRPRRGLPMIHFTPPTLFGAPPIDEIGVGFNPEYARQEMALAGYPDCANFPSILVVTYRNSAKWGEFWVDMAEQHLGCDRAVIEVHEPEFSVIEDPNLPDRERVFRNASNAVTNVVWNGDYPDANSWVGGVLSCHSDSYLMRLCTATDDLIDQAARETDPAIRTDLYRQIEEGFFGPDGEFPIAPLFLRVYFVLAKSWYTGPFETDTRSGIHWNTYSIAMAAKLAARSEP